MPTDKKQTKNTAKTEKSAVGKKQVVKEAKPSPRDIAAFRARSTQASELSAIFNNPSAATSEIHVSLTDFFNSSSVVNLYQQHLADLSSLAKIINVSTSGASKALARITKYELYALPRFANDNVSTAVLGILFGLPVTPSVSGAQSIGSESGSTIATKTTILTPTSVSDWVLVGKWTANSLGSANALLVSNSSGYTALGAFVVVDPDTFTPTSADIQYMAKITFAQTIPNDYLYDGEVVTGGPNLFNEPSPTTPSSALVAMLQAHGVSNIDT